MTHHHLDKAIDRRGMLECMGWAGTGTLFALAGGIDASLTLDKALAATPGRAANEALPVKPFSFLNISDTHIGFQTEAKPNAVVHLKEQIDTVCQLVVTPILLAHTACKHP